MGEDEQVVGVLRQCATCGKKTVHVDGACREHKATSARKWTWHMRWVVPLLLLVGVYVFGRIHILYGASGGVRVCSKVGWTLDDTFIDREDLAANLEFHGKVFSALDKCGAW